MNKDIRTGTIEMTAAMLISGTIGWFVLKSGQTIAEVVFWRCFFGALSLLVVCGLLGFLKPSVISLPRLLVAIFGGIAIVINWLLLFEAYSHASISIATTIYNTQPFMLLGLGALFFRERITSTKIFWLGLAFAGMLAIVEAKPSGGAADANYATGIALALGAAFFYALAAIAAKGLKGTPPHLIALIQVATGTLMLAPMVRFSDLPQTPDIWSILLAIGVFHTGLMYVLLYGAIQKLPTHLTGALSFIYPIAAIVVDRLAFGHSLQPLQVLGSGIILLAAAGMTLGWSLPTFRRNPAS
ncbi:MAG: DMT family transporter [Shinella sp.]|nr:DMT family transporter [Shinella sp.]